MKSLTFFFCLSGFFIMKRKVGHYDKRDCDVAYKN